VGAFGSHTSGDIFLAFSTANPGAAARTSVRDVQILANEHINPLFEATVQATEEAIVNSLAAADTMVGINGNTVYGMPHERVREVMREYNRLGE
jgi:D-aminopeptidase